MASRLLWAFLFIALVAFAPVARAAVEEDDEDLDGGAEEYEDEEDEYEEFEDDELILDAHEDVSTSYAFLKFDEKSGFPSGSKVDALIGITNKGTTEFNITHIRAHLVDASNFFFFIENYTAAVINRALNPGEQVTLQYSFTPNENFEPRQFGFKLLAYYESEDDEFESAIFNKTVSLVEPEDFTDPTTFFTYTGGAAGLLVLFLVFQRFSGSGKRKKRSYETGTQSSTLTDRDLDFLPAELKNQSTGSGSGAAKRRAGKRK